MFVYSEQLCGLFIHFCFSLGRFALGHRNAYDGPELALSAVVILLPGLLFRTERWCPYKEHRILSR